MDYAWKRGFRAPKGISAQSVGERIDELHRKLGVAQAEDVVDEARNTESPLHLCFEWDDEVAAEEHRKSQARTLLRVVVIVAPQGEIEPIPQSTFIRDGQGGGAYYKTLDAMKVPELQARMLAQARTELEAFRRKYEHLMQLASVIHMVDEVLAVWPEDSAHP
jgi:hypothetical protein